MRRFRERALPDDHPDLQAARLNLAVTMGELGDLSGERALLEKVLEVFERTLPPDHPDLQAARQNLLWAVVELGDREASRELVERLAWGVRGRLDLFGPSFSSLVPREMEALATSAQWAISTVLSVQGGSGWLGSMQALEPEGFALVESARSVGSLGRRLRALIEVPDEERDHLEELEEEIVEVAARARAQAFRPKGIGEKIAEPAGEGSESYVDLIRRQERLESERQAILSRLAASQGLEVHCEPGAIAAALGPQEAAVGYWRYTRWPIDGETGEIGRGEASHLAYVVRGDGTLRRVELGPARAIEEAVAAWRSAIGTGPERGARRLDEDTSDPERVSGVALRRLIIDPLWSHLEGVARVKVALDDVLHQVPLEVLPLAEGPGAPRLGDRLEIEVHTTLRERTIEKEAPVAEPSLLAMGGIDYDQAPLAAEGSGGEVIAMAGAAARRGGLARRGAPRDLLRSTPWEAGFGPLSGSRSEVASIAALFEKRFEKKPVVLVGRGASREALEGMAAGVRFVHLATHGYFAPGSVPSMLDDRVIDREFGLKAWGSVGEQVRGFSPMALCGLAFSGANLEPDDYGYMAGLMTAEEISHLDLRGCELVVLSACDTNVGVRRAGQGIASLQQAVYAAGARSSLTSLWKVGDEATAELMQDFYRRWWIQGKPKRQALRESQRRLREALDELGRPRYRLKDWGAWVLVGK